jgi:phenylpropionate dioxygenase-like ring-hydroxylating dioxygenase large terminal subunit
MLSHEQNAYLCEVEPGKPMHNLLKRYWIPAGVSRDVPEPDCDPVRITLLCENYVMFRDSDGKVGILDDNCCHRGASLTLGRVEDGGIRCIYHGWKFDRTGKVLEMPNAADNTLGQTFRQPAYSVREAGGMIFVYLGPKELEPPFPHMPFFDVPEDCRYVGTPLFNANFVQVLEGAIDSAHLGVLHSDVHSKGAKSKVSDAPVVGQVTGQFVQATAPRIEVADAPWGFRYAALRDLNDNAGNPVTQARVTAFFLPFCSNVTDEGSILFAVPVTSEWTINYHVFWQEPGPSAKTRLKELLSFLGWDDEELKERERARHLREIAAGTCQQNGYRQNRAGMRAKECFSGLKNVVMEDIAVTETMGAISNRTIEHLVPSDAAIVRARRLLIRNARKVESGEDPAGTHLHEVPSGGQAFVTVDKPWTSMFSDWATATADAAE